MTGNSVMGTGEEAQRDECMTEKVFWCYLEDNIGLLHDQIKECTKSQKNATYQTPDRQ